MTGRGEQQRERREIKTETDKEMQRQQQQRRMPQAERAMPILELNISYDDSTDDEDDGDDDPVQQALIEKIEEFQARAAEAKDRKRVAALVESAISDAVTESQEITAAFKRRWTGYRTKLVKKSNLFKKKAQDLHVKNEEGLATIAGFLETGKSALKKSINSYKVHEKELATNNSPANKTETEASITAVRGMVLEKIKELEGVLKKIEKERADDNGQSKMQRKK